MRLNENTQIIGKHVNLVPYEPKHVSKYHNWMQSRELQQLTASEPLTLEKEYEMQKTWRMDHDKCTFLILCWKKYETTKDENKALIGDTNLFLHTEQDSGEKVAEIEIMIAEPDMRGKGLGWESTLLMLKYGVKYLNVKKFVAKIGIDNVASIRMFQKIEFQEEARSKVFNEVTLYRRVNEKWLKWLDGQAIARGPSIGMVCKTSSSSWRARCKCTSIQQGTLGSGGCIACVYVRVLDPVQVPAAGVPLGPDGTEPAPPLLVTLEF
uniref:N-acetyltransferase domain-containing protein n=1 Tax=Glossina brevipalpis TaxID=37001 RepID=A0A1A9X1K1_9MUSC